MDIIWASISDDFLIIRSYCYPAASVTDTSIHILHLGHSFQSSRRNGWFPVPIAESPAHYELH